MQTIVTKFHKLLNVPFKKIFKRDLCPITFRQFIKHYLVGMAGVFFNYSFFNLFVLAGLSVVLANCLNGVLVTIITFFLQKHFTYKTKVNSWRHPIGFVATSVGYYFLDTIMLVALVDLLGMTPAIAKIITIAILAPFSFLVQKYIVFKE